MVTVIRYGYDRPRYVVVQVRGDYAIFDVVTTRTVRTFTREWEATEYVEDMNPGDGAQLGEGDSNGYQHDGHGRHAVHARR